MAIDHKIPLSIMTQWIDKKNVIALMVAEDPALPGFQGSMLTYRSIKYDLFSKNIRPNR